MAYVQQATFPEVEPVTLAQAKSYLNLPSGSSDQDDTITRMIVAAREDGERLTDRILAQRQFVQCLDSFPYFIDTIQSQQAYPPSYYSLPRYSTTLWNYSQMIKVSKNPVISIDDFRYVATDGTEKTLQPGVDYIVDPVGQPARIFPKVGGNWPPCLYAPNAVKIVYTAGYDPDPSTVLDIEIPDPPQNPPNQQSAYSMVVGIPNTLVDLLLNLVAWKYQNRGAATPAALEAAFQSQGILDFASTRG